MSLPERACVETMGLEHMRHVFRLAAGVAALSTLAAPALAQSVATSTTAATTTIVQPISIANNSLLAFGSVVKSPTAGSNTITIDPTTGVRTISGAGGGALAGSIGTRATYTATGEGAQTFTVSAPNFNMISGANTLAVTTTTSAATGTLSGAIGSTGTASFGVGGSFPVLNTTPSGVYSGNLAVTIAYN